MYVAKAGEWVYLPPATWPIMVATEDNSGVFVLPCLCQKWVDSLPIENKTTHTMVFAHLGMTDYAMPLQLKSPWKHLLTAYQAFADPSLAEVCCFSSALSLSRAGVEGCRATYTHMQNGICPFPWPAMAGHGRQWLAKAGLGQPRPAMAGPGRPWPAMASHGQS